MRHAKAACSGHVLRLSGMGGVLFKLVPMVWEGTPCLPSRPASAQPGDTLSCELQVVLQMTACLWLEPFSSEVSPAPKADVNICESTILPATVAPATVLSCVAAVSPM